MEELIPVLERIVRALHAILFSLCVIGGGILLTAMACSSPRK